MRSVTAQAIKLFRPLFCLLAFVLLISLSACGPERSASTQESAVQTTYEIATAYQSTHSLADAQTALAQLDVANVNQWLLFTAEDAIKRNENGAQTAALVTLVLDLGLQSNALVAYARQNNLSTMHLAASNLAAPTPNVAENNSTAAHTANNIIIPLPTRGGSTAEQAAAALPELSSTNEPGGENVTSADEPSLDDRGNAGTESGDSAVEQATATPAPTATPMPTTTPDTQPLVRAASGINVRVGPGVEYPVAGAMNAGESAQILNKNASGDWWEISLASGGNGWVYGPLVETTGDTGNIAVAVNIPTPPPTPVPAPTQPPVEAEPTAAPTPVPSGPDFRVVEKRLWDVVENGGRLDGVSVTCGEKRQLVAHVLDANGNLLNGVAVQAIYGAQEIFVTGTQGKGEGTVEFVLGSGQGLKVIRDADGREVSSEEAQGMSTKPWEIPFETLIGGHFCTDDASCQSFVDATGCYGHYSWTVTFQRNY